MAELLFKKGMLAEFELANLTENREEGTFYHVTDEKKIYLGDELVLEDSSNIRGNYDGIAEAYQKKTLADLNRAILDNELVAARALTELDDKKADIATLEDYALKTELPTKTSELLNDSGFITSDGVNVDLTGYATEQWVKDQEFLSEVPEGYATQEWVNEQGFVTADNMPEIDLSTVATKESVEKLTQDVIDNEEVTTAALNKLSAEKADKTEISTYSIAKVTEGLEENILESYVLLVNGEQVEGNSTINIYKDSSLKSVELQEQNLVFTFGLADGTDEIVTVDFGKFINEQEFADGLMVNTDGKVLVKVAEDSESFLSVDDNGVKVSGIQDAIDAAKAELLGVFDEDILEEEKCLTLAAINREILDNELVVAASLADLDDRKADKEYVEEKLGEVEVPSIVKYIEEVEETTAHALSELNGKIELTKNEILGDYTQLEANPDYEGKIGYDLATANKVALEAYDKLIEAEIDIYSQLLSLKAKDEALSVKIQLKQDKINDLATIRSNAAKGATALQSVPAEYITETELEAKGYITADDIPQVEIDTTNLVSKDELAEAKSELLGDFTAIKEQDEQYHLKSFAAVSQTIVDNEVATAAALTDLKANKVSLEEFTSVTEAMQNAIDAKLDSDGVDFSGVESQIAELQTAVNGKQAILTAGNGIDITNNVISCNLEIDSELYVAVSELPTSDIKDNRVYVLLNSVDGEEGNIHEEYMYVNGAWEKVGLNHSNYVTKEVFQELYNGVIENEEITAAAFNQLAEEKADKTELETLSSEIETRGYATETWVSGQGYLTLDTLPETDLSALATKESVDNLITEVEKNEKVIATALTDLKTNKANISSIPTKLSDLTNDSGFITSSDVNVDLTGYATKTDLNAKQDTISDLATIRANAEKGATALQSVPAEYVTETELTNKGYSTTSYVDQKVADLVNGAPDTLNTLDELAAALKDNKDIVTVLENSIANKADKEHSHDNYLEVTPLGEGANQLNSVLSLQKESSAIVLGTNNGFAALAIVPNTEEDSNISGTSFMTDYDIIVDGIQFYNYEYRSSTPDECRIHISSSHGTLAYGDKLFEWQGHTHDDYALASNVLTKEEFTTLQTKVSENEEVTAAALTDLNSRFDNISQNVIIQNLTTTITTLQQTIVELQTEITNIKNELNKTLVIE